MPICAKDRPGLLRCVSVQSVTVDVELKPAGMCEAPLLDRLRPVAFDDMPGDLNSRKLHFRHLLFVLGLRGSHKRHRVHVFLVVDDSDKLADRDFLRRRNVLRGIVEADFCVSAHLESFPVGRLSRMLSNRPISFPDLVCDGAKSSTATASSIPSNGRAVAMDSLHS